ncbi:MAG: mycofactocin biosynthesis glycosyltransferase MftF [Acidimicrobiales bacterium]
MAESSPLVAPIPAGTAVALHPSVRFFGDDLVAGGSPWRLLRLPGASRSVLARWRRGDVVRPGEERLARTLILQGLLVAPRAPISDVDNVDVVIPVHNDADALGHLLDRLADCHVTVVDDGSVDPRRLAALAAAHGATLVRHDATRGPGAARNSGLRATERPFVWFVDCDVILDDALGVLGHLRSALEDPVVAASGPRVRGTPGASARERFEHSFGALDLGGEGGPVRPGGIVPYLPSACLLVRRDAMGDGFDPTLDVGEDVDLVWRLVDRGWLVLYLPHVVVTHPARPTWTRWWRQRVAYGRSSGELARRHGDRLAPLRADRWTLVTWAGLVARAPWLSARTVATLRASVERRLAASAEDPRAVANALVATTVLRAGGPLARATTRTYGPLLWLAALHPRLRPRALAVLAVGTAWRFRGRRPQPSDVVLAVADDLAYAIGVAAGAWRARTWRSLMPAVTASTVTWRDVLGARERP